MIDALVPLAELMRSGRTRRAVEGAVRMAVETVWRLGCRLIERRARTPHGDWGAYLDSVGLTESTAHRYMTMGRRTSHVGDSGTSIRATLTAISETTKAEQGAQPQIPGHRLRLACRPVPRHVMRHQHDAGVLHGFARRPRPRYADGGPGWPAA